MRRRLVVTGSLALLAMVHAACSNPEPPAADICIEAKNRFSSCGTSLPLLTDGPCSGTTKIVARCVVDHAHDCDELATLFGRIDACVADLLDGGDELLPPATDLPVPPRDAGRDGQDEAGRDVDAAPRPADGGPISTTDGGASDSGAEARP
ncbi:MAG: hypothetical protein JWO86_3376 [Myxococcaceae bacterium]|nr:hypothetical protein [Myxococcaceae bacterium]